jgi:hypothetical protein
MYKLLTTIYTVLVRKKRRWGESYYRRRRIIYMEDSDFKDPTRFIRVRKLEVRDRVYLVREGR